MFEQYFPTQNSPRRRSGEPTVLEKTGYSDGLELAEIMEALMSAELSGVQVNSGEHTLVYPKELRERIDALLDGLEGRARLVA